MTKDRIASLTGLEGLSVPVRLWVLIFTALAMTSVAFSQTYRGTINGTVTDSSGAAIAGAQVQVIDENTHFVSPVVTNSQGLYSVPFLTPDTYDVKVEAKGFASAEQTGVVLTATDIKQTNFTLKASEVTASVTVTANTQLVQTESAALGQVISSNEVQNSPNLQDNPLGLATRVAGVYSNFASGSFVSNWRPVGGLISGMTFDGIQSQHLVEIDGITDLPPEGNTTIYTAFIPPPGAIEEEDVYTAPYDAEYGQTSGGVINVVVKDGTQKLHAEASFMDGDTIFTANSFNRNFSGLPRTANNWREGKFTVTGPIIIPKLYHGRDRTYFMVSYEHSTYNIPVAGPFIGSMPTANEHVGDFSQLLSSPTQTTGAGIIYDPASTNLSTGARTSFITENKTAGPTPQAAGCASVATTFNCIPTNRINKVGAALMQYFPLPTTTLANGSSTYINDFNPPNGVSDNEHYYTLVARVDHQFTDANKFSVVGFAYRSLIAQPNEGYPYVNGVTGGSALLANRIFEGGIIEDTHTFSPTTVLSLRLGGQWAPFTQPRPGAQFPLSALGMNGATLSFPANGFPGASVSGPGGGYSGLQAATSIFDYTGQISSSAILSKSIKRHSLKFGAQYLFTRDSTESFQSNITSSTNFTFSTVFTNANPSNTAASNGGDGVAALLLGYPNNGVAQIISPPTYQWHYVAGFVQDDWRVTRRLTLNLGLRYDYDAPVTERHNYLNAGFDLDAPNPMNQGTACSATTCTPPATGVPQGYNGGLLFVTAAHPQGFASEWNDRWQPRVGAAYSIRNGTVLRGGYARFIGPGISLGSNIGFTQNTSVPVPANNYTPASCSAAQYGDAYGFCNMVNPYPNGFVTPTGSSLGLSTSVGQSISYSDYQRDYPMANTWSADLEQQLPFNMVLDVAYHGNVVSGTGITKNWNALPACYYYGGSCPGAGNATALGASVINPMAGYLPATTALNATKLPQSDLDLPYPEFGAINDTVTRVPGTNRRVGEYRYNAMFVQLDSRPWHGLEFRVNTTWAHIEQLNTLLNPTDSVTNPLKFDANQPNVYLVGAVEYNVPKMNIRNRVLSQIVNGWGINQALNSSNGGFVLSPSGAYSTGISAVTPHRSLEHWFNNCYIPIVANGQVGQTLPGASAPNQAPVYGSPQHYEVSNTGVGTLEQGCAAGESPAWIQQPADSLNQISTQQPIQGVRAPWFPYYQVSFVKAFTIHEGLIGQFRTDMLNPLNMDNLANGPSTSLTGSTFGATSYPFTELNDPRIIRFQVKLSF